MSVYAGHKQGVCTSYLNLNNNLLAGGRLLYSSLGGIVSFWYFILKKRVRRYAVRIPGDDLFRLKIGFSPSSGSSGFFNSVGIG